MNKLPILDPYKPATKVDYLLDSILTIAEQFAHLDPDRTQADLHRSIREITQRRGGSPPSETAEMSEAIAAFGQVLVGADSKLIERLQVLLRRLGDEASAIALDREFFALLKRINNQEAEAKRIEADRLKRINNQEAEAKRIEADRRAAQATEAQKEQEERDRWYSQTYTYTVITLDQRGNITQREEASNKGFIETACGLNLEFVRIPTGEFMMGSPDNEAERSSNESPVHRVSLPEYFLSRTTVTQAQWEAVANLDQISLELKTNPSNFKNPNHPVERVSWKECIEFCLRLSQATGKAYRLPSEAEWEYACRAGTTTPFHFGATLSPAIANYDGNHTYGNGQKGTYRQTTIPVKSLKAPNAWGLYHMHGNVWEWCMDDWHGNYNGAPTDGSAWLENDNHSHSGSHEQYLKAVLNSVNSNKLLRGGSWYSSPQLCRSAYRFRHTRDLQGNGIGFRLFLPRT
jgi:formylglycine-generating enzyme required for sulfatase activity